MLFLLAASCGVCAPPWLWAVSLLSHHLSVSWPLCLTLLSLCLCLEPCWAPDSPGLGPAGGWVAGWLGGGWVLCQAPPRRPCFFSPRLHQESVPWTRPTWSEGPGCGVMSWRVRPGLFCYVVVLGFPALRVPHFSPTKTPAAAWARSWGLQPRSGAGRSLRLTLGHFPGEWPVDCLGCLCPGFLGNWGWGRCGGESSCHRHPPAQPAVWWGLAGQALGSQGLDGHPAALWRRLWPGLSRPWPWPSAPSPPSSSRAVALTPGLVPHLLPRPGGCPPPVFFLWHRNLEAAGDAQRHCHREPCGVSRQVREGSAGGCWAGNVRHLQEEEGRR